MSKLETNTIDTVSGTSNLVIGSTNTSTITMPNGALSGQNYPAFEAHLSASQSVSDAVTTKVQFDAEDLDTDNCYDNSTNYRFTPTVAGKYFVFARVMALNTSNTNLASAINFIYKNGASISREQIDFTANYIKNASINNSLIVDMNGSSDYLEVFGSVNVISGGSPSFYGASPSLYRYCRFGAYRIGA